MLSVKVHVFIYIKVEVTYFQIYTLSGNKPEKNGMRGILLYKQDYRMSEQAFLDVWEEFGCPKELHDEELCFQFLKKLYDKTDGLFIVDHFSYTNYDHITRLELKDNFLYLYWKDYEKNPPVKDSMIFDVFGNTTYMYSMCNLRNLKFINAKGHLFILFMPNASKLKEVKKVLSIEKLEEDKEILTSYDVENLCTHFRFLKDGKIHESIVYNFPAYSFLIQPKQGNRNVDTSKFILLHTTLSNAVDRINKAQGMLNQLNDYDYDEIHSIGNRARTILESIVKYYCVYSGYSLPKEQYEKNMLGDLKKHLLKQDDSYIELKQGTINNANNFSHDEGKVYPKSEAEKLCADVLEIIKAVYISIKEKDFA
jgi:hypothetical protein